MLITHNSFEDLALFTQMVRSMQMRTDYLGIDLAFRNCAIVRAKIIDGTIRKAVVLNEWNKSGGLGIKTPITQLARFFNSEILTAVSNTVEPLEGLYIGIDFDPLEGHFKTTKRGATTKAFVTGFIYYGFLAMNARPLVIPPSVVRENFSLPRNASKEDVHFKFRDKVPMTGEALFAWSKMSEHARDALILSYISSNVNKKDEKGNNQWNMLTTN